MKVQAGVLAMAIAIGMISGACNPTTGTLSGTGGSSSGTAGSTGTAGTGGPSCPNGAPCGGSVVGTWNVTSSCLNLSGALDISLVGLDPRTCKSASISGSINVSGTWTANANGTYTDGTTTTGSATVQLEAGCLILSGTTVTCTGIQAPLSAVGFSDVSCANAATGGGCTCTGTVNHMGSIGWMTLDPQTNGNYTTSGNTLTLDGMANYGYCVSGDKLTLASVGVTSVAEECNGSFGAKVACKGRNAAASGLASAAQSTLTSKYKGLLLKPTNPSKGRRLKFNGKEFDIFTDVENCSVAGGQLLVNGTARLERVK